MSIEKSKLRSWAEVQRAHDYMHAIVTGELKIPLPDEYLTQAHTAHDVLAWTLCMPCGAAFEANLKALQDDAKRWGYSEIPLI